MVGFDTALLSDQAAWLAATDAPISPSGFLFNEPAHLRQQAHGPFSLLTLTDRQTGIIQARCALFQRGEIAISPGAAPFGSIEFSEHVSPHLLSEFVDVLIDKARLAGCQRLRLVNYPHCYAPRQAHRLIYTLTEAGFDIAQNTPTFYLPVSSTPLTSRMHAQERQRLRKNERQGLVASQWHHPCVSTVIRFIEESRRQQGYPLTITASCLSGLLQQFPTQFPVFIVREGLTIAALCVCVRVRHDILYTFLPASNAAYRPLSPMVLLINHLYAYCQRETITLLDLGPALDAHHQPKPSLARFKQNMGAVTSPKLTFEILL